MRKRIDPKEQFSKWLAKSGAIYWICFLSALIVVIIIRPEVAIACVYLAIIVSVVMIFHVWAYTKNSTYEKGVLALLDKTRMELSLKEGSKEDTGNEEASVTEGEENG
jgi:cobalamin biosynthesis protein CobD/CbiB